MRFIGIKGLGMSSLRWVLLALVLAGLGASFWWSSGWLELCAGLAVFLFGMQCLEEGLKQLAGGKLEQILARSTATPFKGLLFGVGGTLLLQSSTLVSLLTIAFISTGLITLAGGIAILLGANLGATSGIWLLALAGQNVSLSPLALPLLVFGILAGFFGAAGKAGGRIVLGIAFIFLGIDQIKEGFNQFDDGLDLTALSGDGLYGAMLFTGIGMLVTVVLQSSHATLMLTLAALAGGQLELSQSLAIAIGSNVGSSVTTGIVGSLGGNRSGQRLALAHVLFNVVTGVLAFVLLAPLTWLVQSTAQVLGVGSNTLIQLAAFHTLFNALGVMLFWPLQQQLAKRLVQWLPVHEEPAVLIENPAPTLATEAPLTRARYLDAVALDSVESASGAVARELGHLGRLSLEVICHALYLPPEQLPQWHPDSAVPPEVHPGMDADYLYQRHIKGVYGDLLSFMGRMELPMDEAHQQFWVSCQLSALQLVDAVKDTKHLQKNLSRHLLDAQSPAHSAYVELREQLLRVLQQVRELATSDLPGEQWQAHLRELDQQAANFDSHYRQQLFAMVRSGQLDGLQTSSLMNDLGYASRIFQSLRNVLMIGDEHLLLRELQRLEPSPVGVGQL